VECAAAAAALALLAYLLSKRTANRAWLAIPPALVFVGILLAVVHTPAGPPSLSVPDNVPAILEGCVVDPALIASDRERFTLELSPSALAQVALFARPSDRGETKFPNLPYGTRVEFTGKVRRPHNREGSTRCSTLPGATFSGTLPATLPR
jgi:hypothetical protein